MKRVLIGLTLVSISIYCFICFYLYFNQESFIFLPHYLSKNEKFDFDFPYEEKYIPVEDTIKIHGIYVKADSSKGLLFFLHGNGGSLAGWGQIAPLFIQKGYDFFAIDYRSYGKSHGKFSNENTFFNDVDKVYEHLKMLYPEDKITIVGHSLGSAPASFLAAHHSPEKLILLAPFYSIKDEMKTRFPFIPSFILKYPFENNIQIANIKCPFYILHGNKDWVISPKSSEKLMKSAKVEGRYLLIQHTDHQEILYSSELEEIL